MAETTSSNTSPPTCGIKDVSVDRLCITVESMPGISADLFIVTMTHNDNQITQATRQGRCAFDHFAEGLKAAQPGLVIELPISAKVYHAYPK